jgi:dihydroxyacetone kinase phosphoprotein-dependent L subunit
VVTRVLDVAAAKAWVTTFVAAFEAERVELTDLDRRAGDGDFGTNLSEPLERAAAVVAAMGADVSVGQVFDALASAMMRAGGTSGPLFGAWFKAFARVGAERSEVGLDDLAVAASSGVDAVRRLGQAEVGDSTMVDAQVPAARALNEAVEAGLEIGPALARSADAAAGGARATGPMSARRGRASYVGAAAVGVEDPGARTVALFFRAGRSVLDTQSS